MTARLAAIIAAHDEAGVLGAAIESLRQALPPPDVVLVIADHCADDTAAVAGRHGAVVFERREGRSGKGAALAWLFAQWPAALAACDLAVVFDADTTVRPDFFAQLRHALEAGAPVVQAFVQPTGFERSPAATLAAYSEVLSQLADDRLRARLGWPVPLRGTGMAAPVPLLREILPQLHTRTEDAELSLLLTDRGLHVGFAAEAVLYDPKPPAAALVARQRARWLQGLAEVWRGYAPVIARLLWRGPAAWSLMQAVLLKPKTLYLALKTTLLLAVLLTPLPAPMRLGAALLVLGDVAYYVGGLALTPDADRGRYARALLAAPLYLWVWAVSLVTALRARAGWLSVRR